ncbi:MAG: hypothetical protein WD226_11980 [Planctomycetota bacterium]
MPVWHAKTRAAVANGELAVVGIAQEQHPERMALYAAWQRLDWPLLFDPFNLTDAEVVLNAYLVAPGGVIWKAGARPDDLEAFLAADFDSSAALAGMPEPRLVALDGEAVVPTDAGGLKPVAAQHVSRALFGAGEPRLAALRHLAFDTLTVDEPRAWFRRGVALRMLFDDEGPRTNAAASASLFTGAVDAWARALERRPSQYIWRRRLQQYGPALDKPYPFYDWIDEAQATLLERGDAPIPLRAALTPTERLGRDAPVREPGAEPDPDARLPRDEGWFEVDVTVVADTQGRPRASAHVSITPLAAEDAEWNDEAGPVVVWIEGVEAVVPAQRLEHRPAPGADARERRTLSFELDARPGAVLSGYAVLQVCEADVCRTVRHGFSFTLKR